MPLLPSPTLPPRPSGFFPTCLPTTPSGGAPSVACYAARCDPSIGELPFASASADAIEVGPAPLYFLVGRGECQSGTTFDVDSRTVVCPSSAQCRFTNCSCDLPGGGVCSLGQSECSSRSLYNTAWLAASKGRTQSRRSRRR